jgi:serine/threonine protein kinase
MTAYRMQNAAGELFAVKMVKTEDMKHLGETRADVEREARTLELMKHRHVIKYYRQPRDSLLYEDDDEEVLGLVMEWAKGGSLGDLIKARAERSQNVSMLELLDMNIQMAKALDYIHDEGIVHCNVKADNVLLANTESESVWIKLADFGVAAESAYKHRPRIDAYLSPEQAQSSFYGTKVDMWAVGCILVELACCQRLKTNGSLWAPEAEVNDRRDKYFTQVCRRNEKLADIARSLLDRQASSRWAALQLRVSLEKLKNCLEPDQQQEQSALVRRFQQQQQQKASGPAQEHHTIAAAAAQAQTKTQTPAAASPLARDVALGSGGCARGEASSKAVQNPNTETGPAATHPNKKQKVVNDADTGGGED